MPTLQFKSSICISAPRLYNWHASGGAFERLAPPWQNIQVSEWRGGEQTLGQSMAVQFGDISTGTSVHLRQHIGPISIQIIAEHVEHKRGVYFVDEMKKGPFSYWRHTHRFISESEHTSVLDDLIEYELPLKWLTNIGAKFVEKELQKMFTFRHRRTYRDALMHSRFINSPKQNILIVGMDDFTRQLGAFLRNGGHQVHYLSQKKVEMHSHTTWKEASSDYFFESPFDAVILSSLYENTLRSPEAVMQLYATFGGQLPQKCMLIGEASEIIHKVLWRLFDGKTNVIHLGVPAVFDGGHLCFAERHHRKKQGVVDGWCTLDDLLGGILSCLQGEKITGRVDWQAPGNVPLNAFTKSGLRIAGGPIAWPNWFIQWKYPSLLENIAIEHSGPDYAWLEPELLHHLDHPIACSEG